MSRSPLLLFLMATLIGVNECSQSSNLTWTHVGNFFAAPVNWLSDVVSGDTEGAIEDKYEKYSKKDDDKTSEAKLNLNQVKKLRCDLKFDSPVPTKDNFKDIKKKIIETYCGCKAWDAPLQCDPNPTQPYHG